MRVKSLLKGRGRLTTKMNITFFIGNEVLNIFSFNNFLDKSNIFPENGGKKMFAGHVLRQIIALEKRTEKEINARIAKT